MNSLISFWFHRNGGNYKYQAFWFDGSQDKYISETFWNDLKEAEKLEINQILSLEEDKQFYYLLLFDQITRNISRFSNENPYRNDIWALQIAKHLIYKNYDQKIPFIKRIFILLPYRHSGIISNMDFVIARLNLYHSLLLDNEKQDYQRFYIATLKNYTWCTENINIIKPCQQILVFDEVIHDKNCQSYNQIISNDIVIDLNKNKLYQSVLSYCRKYRITKLGVSLSGGVDSMVLLYILRQMVLRNELENVVAIHIDYHWRKESTQEAQFLVHFCNHLDIDIVLRNITHFDPKVDTYIDITRETVEEETKMIRFNTYKYSVEKYDLHGICLGHHKDDLIENVFMNMSKGKNLLDLFVTEEYSLQHDVIILRPMLSHHKADVLEIAHKNSIIYVKDTTPDWSFRGTMRKKIFPTMTDFDPIILNNLHRMGHQSAQWGGFIKNKILKPILESTKKYKFGISFDMNIDYSDIHDSFWSELLANFFHSNGIRMITQKNLGQFMNWLERNNPNEKIRLSNDHLVFIRDKRFFFVKVDFFEKIKNELMGIKNEINVKTIESKINLKMSQWNVEIDRCENPEDNIHMCYEDILNGEFKYNVKTNEKLIIGLGEKNKIFNNIFLLTHLVPKIETCKIGENIFLITYFLT